MKSSGIKRGLAALAVSAIAATGIPLAANAIPIDDQVGNYDITLYLTSSSLEKELSIKPDGTDSTISLVAGAGSDIAQVTFQYKPSAVAGPWTNIGTVSRNAAGAFEFDWAAPASLIDQPIDIRAIGDSDSPPGPGDPTQVISNVDTNMVVRGAGHPTTEAYALRNSDTIGVFQAPSGGVYPAGPDHWLAINGTTSAPAGSYFDAGWMLPNGELAPGIDAGSVTAAGTFQGIVDITDGGYTYDGTVPIEDEIVVYGGGNQGGGYNSTMFSQDQEAHQLYKQVVTSISAQPSGGNIPDGTTTPVTITVEDQNGEPIAGAHVDNGAGATGFTNGFGQVTFSGADAQGAVSRTYHVDATGTAGYQPGSGDKAVTVNLGSYVPAATSLQFKSTDGDAFDFDEIAGGQISVQVKDQTGANFDAADAQDLNYHWEILPFPVPFTPAPTLIVLPDQTQTVDNNGEFNVDFPAGQPAGAYTLVASLTGDGGGNNALPEAEKTYKAGEAHVDFDGDEPQWADVNTTATVTGTLMLDDGTPLPGRRLNADWTRGAAADGDDPSPDTTLVGGDPQTVTTSGAGKFSVQVRDVPGGAENSELGGFLTVAGQNTPGIGPNPDLSNDHGVDFVTDVVPAGARLFIDNVECPNDPFIADDLENQCNFFDESFTPGDLQQVDVTLTQADGVTPLKGRKVSLTVDKGFFADVQLPFATLQDWMGANENVTDGSYYPQWKSKGTTITVATDSSGESVAQVAIERDAGFDDDGKVTAVVTGTAGAANDTADFLWDTVNNEGHGGNQLGQDAAQIDEISIELTPGQALPVRINEPIRYDVFARDGFGNLVKNVEVTVDCAVDQGDDDPCPTFTSTSGIVGNAYASDFDNGGDFNAVSENPGAFNFTAVAEYNNLRWQEIFTHIPDFLIPLGLSEEIEDGFTGEWYDVDLNTSTYTISTSPANPVEPGTPVTVTVTAVDGQGNPLPGLRVEFVRTGDPQFVVFTDTDGIAQYVFEVTDVCEMDNVNATIRDSITYDGDAADLSIVKQLNTTVESACEAEPIQVGIDGRNSENKKRDIIDVSAATVDDTLPVTGAEVDLYKVVDGERVQVGNKERTLNSAGEATFRIRDRNGRGKTTYVAVVRATPTTMEGESVEYTRR